MRPINLRVEIPSLFAAFRRRCVSTRWDELSPSRAFGGSHFAALTLHIWVKGAAVFSNKVSLLSALLKFAGPCASRQTKRIPFQTLALA